jgi:hypothetical protein
MIAITLAARIRQQPRSAWVNSPALPARNNHSMPDGDDNGPIGSAHTKLVVIRGNSGSGKSSIARELRLRYGRGCALVEQDYLRRIVLRERDKPGGLAPSLIAHTVRFALDHDYHVILEASCSPASTPT